MDKKVVILGNGFDLSSGLKSKYSDFFLKELTKNWSLLNRAFLHFKEELPQNLAMILFLKLENQKIRIILLVK